MYGSFLVHAPRNCSKGRGRRGARQHQATGSSGGAQHARSKATSDSEGPSAARLHGVGVVHAPQDLDFAAEVAQRNLVGALEDFGGHQRAVPGVGRSSSSIRRRLRGWLASGARCAAGGPARGRDAACGAAITQPGMQEVRRVRGPGHPPLGAVHHAKLALPQLLHDLKRIWVNLPASSRQQGHERGQNMAGRATEAGRDGVAPSSSPGGISAQRPRHAEGGAAYHSGSKSNICCGA